MNTFIWLIVGHYLGDFVLQNDYVAKNKAPGNANWIHCMIAHCAIQAGTVYFFTASPILGGLEFAIHFVVDVLKCGGHLSFNMDQAIHITCRIVWALIAVHLL